MASRASILKKKTTSIPIPVREITTTDSIACGFRAAIIECEHGAVTAGAGFGSPWINIEWKGRRFAIYGPELLAAVVRSYDEDDAKLIEGASVGGGVEVTCSSSED